MKSLEKLSLGLWNSLEDQSTPRNPTPVFEVAIQAKEKKEGVGVL
jgi:hypothetical protein